MLTAVFGVDGRHHVEHGLGQVVFAAEAHEKLIQVAFGRIEVAG